MITLQVGDYFKSKTGWKSKFKGRTFKVVKVTEHGALLCHVVGMKGYFYITKKRDQGWIDRHIQPCLYKPISLENK